MPDTATIPGHSEIVVTPLSDAGGAEISGIDLREPIDDATANALRQAWLDHKILLIRNQDIAEEDQERFCLLFGELAGLKSQATTTKTLWVTNKEEPERVAAVQRGEMMFHIDQAYSELPCKGSTLSGVIIPDVGGNTCFSNCAKVYASLSDDWQRRLEGLTALNYFNYDTNPSTRPGDVDPNAPQYSHPVVRTHPETGEKSVFVNRLMSMRINDLDRSESDEILHYLFDRIEEPANIYEHVWQVGDLVLWDNRCTAHARTDYDSEKRRLLRRMTILDENPVV